MVKVDLDIKGVVGLLELGNLSKKKAEGMLQEFNKEQLIDYIVELNTQQEVEDESSDDEARK